MAYFYSLFPVKVYTREVPVNFGTPSMYFPRPFSFDGNDTTSTFLKTYNLSVKLFHKDSQQAGFEAERIADKVRSKRNVIPIVDDKGAETGDFIRFTKLETREADKGEFSIVLDWDSRYYYEKPDWNAATYFEFKSGVKY